MAINGKGKPTQFVDYFGMRWAQVKGPFNHYINLNKEENLRKDLDSKIKEINEKDNTITSLSKDVTKLQGENGKLKVDKTNLEGKLNAIPVDWKKQINDAKKQIDGAYKLLKVNNNEEIKTLLKGKKFKKIIEDADALPATEKERNDLRNGINAVETYLKNFQGEMTLEELENKFANFNQKVFADVGLAVAYDVLRETIKGMIELDKANRERLSGKP